MITIGTRVRIMRGLREDEWGAVEWRGIDKHRNNVIHLRVALDKGSWVFVPESDCKTLAQLKQMVADGEL